MNLIDKHYSRAGLLGVFPDREALVEALRATAFLDIPPPPVQGKDRLVDASGRAFGPALAKLTPWRHHLLMGYQSPFVLGASQVTRARLLQALYLCSTAYRHERPFAFAIFRARWFWATIRAGGLWARAFSAWLDDAFLLMPPVPVGERDADGRPAADAHWLAEWVRLGRNKLGLSEAEVLHMPYVRLWQYVDLELGSDPGRPRFDRKKARARGEYLKKKMKQRS